MEVENKKIWPTVLSWGFLALSMVIMMYVPGVSERFSGMSMVKMAKNAFSFDYRLTLGVFGFLAFIFLVMYGIDYLRKKHLGYAPPSDTKLKELEKGLRSFRVILETWRVYAVIIGTIILVAGFFGIAME